MKFYIHLEANKLMDKLGKIYDEQEKISSIIRRHDKNSSAYNPASITIENKATKVTLRTEMFDVFIPFLNAYIEDLTVMENELQKQYNEL